MKQHTQKDYVKTALRLPPDLHAALHEAAREGARTYNGELIHRLNSTFKKGAMKQRAKDQGSAQN